MNKYYNLKILFLVGFMSIALCNYLWAESSLSKIQCRVNFDQNLPMKDSFFISQPVFSPRSKYVAAFFNGSKMLVIFDVQAAKILSTLGPEILFGHKLPEFMKFFGQDSQKLLVIKAGQPVKVINWQTKEVLKTFPVPDTGHKINCFDMTTDGKYLAIGTRNGLQLWNLTTGKMIKTILPGKPVSALDISFDNNYLIYTQEGYALNCVRVVDLNTLVSLEKPLVKISKQSKKCISNHTVSYLKYIDRDLVVTGLKNQLYYEQGLPGIYLLDTKNVTLRGGVKPVCRNIKDIRFDRNKNLLVVASAHYDELDGFCSGIDFIDSITMKPLSRKIMGSPFLSASISSNLKWIVSVSRSKTEAFLSLYTLIVQ